MRAVTISIPAVIVNPEELIVISWLVISIIIVHGKPRHMNISKVFDPIALHIAIDPYPN